ncbi:MULTISPECIES: GntR family transcriptional regulator [Actinoplanes]|uniref:GntR family transcriptional regulator n=1 Tax=Actinoplanes TaxID=1865 RepID=UPI0005F2CF56|nr:MULTISPECIES: GntR family transcriptional regulator [Actinoplanes]GLY02130.1 transcriptional regulator [Actinoplanes sp. NBRC 101535]
MATDRTLRDTVYTALRDRIVGLHHPPGSRLIERDLATELDVSRIPLREALQLLQQDGLVVIVPRQGAIVAPFTADDVRDLFDVRESLEVLAARLAAERATPAGLARLREHMDAARDAAHRHDEAATASANAAFHHEVVAIAANPLLSDMMRPLAARVQWLFHLTRRRDPVRQCEEHEEMYTAFADGDVTAAERLAFDHVRSGRAESIELAGGWSTGGIDPVAATRTRRRLG